MLGDTWFPTTLVAVIVPEVGAPDWNDALIGSARLSPSWSVAWLEMSTVYSV